MVYTDTFSAYQALDVSGFYHMSVNHSGRFADQQNPIKGIECFWNQAKRYMCQFSGIKQANFYWFLKECEWRFNRGSHKKLLKQLKYWDKHAKY